MSPPRTIRVFLASPGDLAVERRAFKDAIDLLNLGFGDGANVRFIPLGWEDTLAIAGRRAQSAISEEIDRCDVFILAMYRRGSARRCTMPRLKKLGRRRRLEKTGMFMYDRARVLSSEWIESDSRPSCLCPRWKSW